MDIILQKTKIYLGRKRNPKNSPWWDEECEEKSKIRSLTLREFENQATIDNTKRQQQKYTEAFTNVNINQLLEQINELKINEDLLNLIKLLELRKLYGMFDSQIQVIEQDNNTHKKAFWKALNFPLQFSLTLCVHLKGPQAKYL